MNDELKKYALDALSPNARTYVELILTVQGDDAERDDLNAAEQEEVDLWFAIFFPDDEPPPTERNPTT